MRLRLALFAIFLVGWLLGCAGKSSPSTPTAAPLAPSFTEPILASLSGILTNDANPTFALMPAREVAAIGDLYNEVGLSTTLLRTFAGAVQVTSVERYPDGTLAVGIEVRHPFPLATRPDLHAFNLKAHVQTPGTGFADGLFCDPGRLRNADGYSRLWAPHVTEGFIDLLPYRIVSRDLTTPEFDAEDPQGWNVFAAGSTQSTMLEFALTPETAQLPVTIYFTADFGVSATFETRQEPEYELPEYAGLAPWRVQVSTLRNELGAGTPATSADFRLEIWHWAEGADLGRDVSLPVTVSLPDLAPDQTIATFTGTGSGATPLAAEFTFSNELAAGEGRYYGVVRVETEADGGNLLRDDLATPEFVKAYATWQVFWVEVGTAPPVGDPPVPVIARPCAMQTLGVGRPVTFDASGTMDTEDAPEELQYEWASNYNGVKFLPDAFGQLATFTYESEGPKTLALAVTDTDNNRVLIELELTVAPEPWQGQRELVHISGVNDVLREPLQLSDGMMFTPDGVPMVMTRDPDDTGAVNLFHFGMGCPPVAMPIYLPTDTLPDITVRDTTAYFAWSPYTTEIYAATLDLANPGLADEVVVMDSQQLLADSIPKDRAILVDPGTGNLLLVAELRYTGDGMSQLWASEKNPSGDWSTPFFLHERANGTDMNPPHLALGPTLGSVMLVWADTVPGPPDFAMRRTMSARYSFGVQSIDDPVDTLLQLGTVSDYTLRATPDGGLCGIYTDALQPTPRYLRYDPVMLTWSATAVGNLTTPQSQSRIVIDEAGIVTVAWIETPPAMDARLITERFAYDASVGDIANGTIEVVRATANPLRGEPQLGVIPQTGALAIAWLETIAGDRQVWGATY